MPNTQVVFYNPATLTTAPGGLTATIKLSGSTVDTQVTTSTGAITSNNLVQGNAYVVTFSGTLTGSYVLYTSSYPTDALNGASNLGLNATPSYTVNVNTSGVTTTTAPATSVLPSPNPAIQTAFITFWNAATGTVLASGITATLAISGGATVDTQVINAFGQITSKNLLEAPVYTVTFTGTGAPSGTFTCDPVGNQLNTCII